MSFVLSRDGHDAGEVVSLMRPEALSAYRSRMPAPTRSVAVPTAATDIYAGPMATITVYYGDCQHDEYVDRTQHKTGSAQARFDYYEEANGALTILDVAGGDRTAQELVRYAPGCWVKVERSPGRIRRIEEWDPPGRRPAGA